MARKSWIVFGLLLLAALTWGLLAHLGSDTASLRSRGDGHSDDTEPATLLGRADTRTKDRGEADVDNDKAVAEALRWLEDHQSRERHPPVAVHLTIKGAGDPLPGDTHVRVTVEDSFEEIVDEVEAQVGPKGAVAEVASLLDRPHVNRLTLHVDVPGYLPHQSYVWLPQKRPHREDLKTEVRLSPAYLLEGRIVDERGVPLEGCDVVGWPASDGKPYGGPGLGSAPCRWYDATTTDARGAFRLRIDRYRDCVVLAHRKDRPLISHHIDPNREDASLVRQWTMPMGRPLSGQVTLHGARLDGAVVRVRPASEDVVDLSIQPPWEGSVMWTKRGAVASGQRTRTDRQGRFAFEGLAPVPHRVELVTVEGRLHDVCAVHETEARGTPPAHGLTVELPLVPVHLTFRKGGKPLEADVVVLSPEGEIPIDPWQGSTCRFTLHVPATDPPLVYLAPGRHYRIQATTQGGVPLEALFTAPGATGTQKVVLDLVALDADARAKSVVLLRLRDDAGTPLVEDFWCVGHGRGNSGDSLPCTPLGDGRYRVELPAPGRWWLQLSPGTDSTWFLRVGQVVVDAAPRRTPTYEVLMRRGGRLRIAARDESGKLLRAGVDVRTEGGSEEEVGFASPDGSGHSQEHVLHYHEPSTTLDPLAPGRYVVTLRHEGQREARTVEIRPGEITEVEVTFTGGR